MRVAAQAGRVHAIFCARGAPKIFRNFAIFAVRFWRDVCVLSTPNARFFGMVRNVDSANFSDVSLSMRSARWPDACSFCARGAPEFRKFCNFFAQVWRKICVTSTSDAHFFVFGRTADSMKSFSDVLQFTQRMLADLKQFLCARRVKIPGNFAIISRDFCGRFA